MDIRTIFRKTKSIFPFDEPGSLTEDKRELISEIFKDVVFFFMHLTHREINENLDKENAEIFTLTMNRFIFQHIIENHYAIGTGFNPNKPDTNIDVLNQEFNKDVERQYGKMENDDKIFAEFGLHVSDNFCGILYPVVSPDKIIDREDLPFWMPISVCAKQRFNEKITNNLSPYFDTEKKVKPTELENF